MNDFNPVRTRFISVQKHVDFFHCCSDSFDSSVLVAAAYRLGIIDAPLEGTFARYKKKRKDNGAIPIETMALGPHFFFQQPVSFLRPLQ